MLGSAEVVRGREPWESLSFRVGSSQLCLRRESAYSCCRSGAPHFQPIAKPTPAHAANSSSGGAAGGHAVPHGS